MENIGIYGHNSIIFFHTIKSMAQVKSESSRKSFKLAIRDGLKSSRTSHRQQKLCVRNVDVVLTRR